MLDYKPKFKIISFLFKRSIFDKVDEKKNSKRNGLLVNAHTYIYLM